MIKDIVLHLEFNERMEGIRNYAISLAEDFDAHLTAVAFSGVGIPSVMMPDFPADVIGKMIEASENAAREAVDQFEASCRNRIPYAQHLVPISQSGAPEIFSIMARRFDLSVVMQADKEADDAGNSALIEAALFGSGRPLIVVPYFHKGDLLLDRVICCWDGSRAAARAINDALPILRKAKIAELLVVANEKTKDDSEIRGADIGTHLARHGVKIEVEILPAPNIDVPNAILSHVADCSADMIVMGGYGHSRLRELVLGGVTREILQTMTVPVFMSH